MFRLLFVIIALSSSLASHSWQMLDCSGSEPDRKAAFTEFGEIIQAYIIENGGLLDLTEGMPEILRSKIPNILRGSFFSGSSKEGYVLYACHLEREITGPKGGLTATSEECNFSLNNSNLQCKVTRIVERFD